MAESTSWTPTQYDQRVVSQSIPPELLPYANEIMSGASGLYQTGGYQPYPDQRLADVDPMQQAAWQGLGSLTGPWQYGMASNTAAGIAGQGPLNYAPGTFSSGYMANPLFANQWNTQAMNQYMDPYMQGVVGIAQREAVTDTQRQLRDLNARATQQGAFGGSRNALENMEFQRNANQRFDDLALKGMSQAYQSALQAFGGDRDAALRAAMATEENRQRQATLGLEAQRMGEQSRQFGADYGLRGATTQLQAGEQLGRLGTLQQQDYINRLREQERAGAMQQATQQQGLDLAYQDYLTQQQYPYKQLEWYNNILRGIPASGNYASTTSTYQAPPSIYSQLGGLGLGSLALWNMFSGTK